MGGGAGAAGGGGPSTGSGRTEAGGARGGEWGMRGWGTETPRAAPRPWVPARAGTTMGVWGDGERCWCRGPPSSALRTGFDRLRANGGGKRACGGGWRMRGGTETPRAAPLPWVPAFARTTMGVWGLASVAGGRRGVPLGGTGASRSAPAVGCGRVGSAMGVGGGVPHLAAPLGTCFRRYDGGGCAGQQMLLVSGGSPALAGRAIRESPLRWGGGRRGCEGGWWWCPA